MDLVAMCGAGLFVDHAQPAPENTMGARNQVSGEQEISAEVLPKNERLV